MKSGIEILLQKHADDKIGNAGTAWDAIKALGAGAAVAPIAAGALTGHAHSKMTSPTESDAEALQLSLTGTALSEQEKELERARKQRLEKQKLSAILQEIRKKPQDT